MPASTRTATSTQRSDRNPAKRAPLGPGSITWATASDPRSLLTGTAAGIMQLMLPGLGAGVTDHSDFFNDPYDRIFRSIPMIWRTIFADDARGGADGHFVRDLHRDIKGTDHHGSRYHALDPDVFWWAHATFTWEFFRARQLLWPVPLSLGQRRQMYAETVTWYERYGVSDRPVPPTLEEFWKKFDAICTDQLEVTPSVEWVIDPTRNPATGAERVHLPGPLSFLNGWATDAMSEVQRTLVYGFMPDVVRRRINKGWTNADRLRFVGLCATIRGLSPAFDRGLGWQLFPDGTPRLAPGTRDQITTHGSLYTKLSDRTPSD